MKKIDPVAIVSILSLSLLLWKHILDLQIQGEGFQYFAKSVAKINVRWPLNHDMLAKILFNILPNLFQERINLYMWFMFGFMLLTNIVFYLCLQAILQKKIPAFFAALLFSISYAGQYDAYSSGGYQFFIQRNTILLPMLLSFLFLVLFFRHSRLRYYLLALGIFLVSIALGFFGTFFTPIIVFYITTYSVLNLKTIKRKLFGILLNMPFIGGNLLIAGQSGYAHQETSLIEFIIGRFWYVVTGVTQQILVITIPDKQILDILLSPSNQNKTLTLTIFIYVLSFFIVWLKKPTLRVLTLTSVSSLLTILLLNQYLNAANVLNTLGSSRYFYFPYTMVALFWGIFLTIIFEQKKLITISFCLFLIIGNYYLIYKNREADESKNKANKDTIEFLETWKSELKTNPSYVILPANLGANGSGFALRFYSHMHGNFIVESLEPYDKSIAKSFGADHVYVLHYDNVSEKVINLTDETRKKLTYHE